MTTPNIIKDINFGLNQYCGPAVLSALTGKSTDECAAVIQAISNQKEIKAVHVDHLIAALSKLRFDVVKENVVFNSLYGNMNHLSNKPGAYIIIVPRHVVAVEVTEDKKVFLVDNHSKQPLNVQASARLSQRVEQIFKIIPRSEPKLIKRTITHKSIGNHNIEFEAEDIYEDVRDNVKTRLGWLYTKNIQDLKDIYEEIEWIITDRTL